jgi:hypothetical protein
MFDIIFGASHTHDVVLDSFYSPAFATEGEYLKAKRQELIEKDKKSKKEKKLLVNNPDREVTLRGTTVL